MNRIKSMMHLTPEQLVDVAEGTRPESAAPHLAECDVCRRSLVELRATLGEAAGLGVPEPSPLFWEHLSSRIRGDVAQERLPGTARSIAGWLRPRVVVPLLATAAAIAVAVGVSRRPELPQPSPATPLPTANAQLPSQPPVEPFGVADDPSLRLMADYGTTLGLDDIRQEIALDTHVGGSDEVVIALTAEERQELQRLLEEEMAQPSELGAS